MECKWEQNFQHLKEFAAKYGHTWVPRDYTKHPHLAAWVASIQAQWRERDGQRSGLTIDQEAKLRDIGFEFEKHTRFAARIAQLRDMKSKGKRLEGRLPNSGTYHGLRDWAEHQRKLWKEGRLPKEREEQLLGVDFVFDVSDKKWQKRLEEMDDYVGKRGFLVSFTQQEYIFFNLCVEWLFLNDAGILHIAENAVIREPDKKERSGRAIVHASSVTVVQESTKRCHGRKAERGESEKFEVERCVVLYCC